MSWYNGKTQSSGSSQFYKFPAVHSFVFFIGVTCIFFSRKSWSKSRRCVFFHMSLLFCSEGNTRYEEMNNKMSLEKIAQRFLKKSVNIINDFFDEELKCED